MMTMLQRTLMLVTLIVFSLHLAQGQSLANKVIFGVNAGGPRHVDIFGVRYEADPLTSEGIASDHGLRFDIRRAAPQDQILYQTERYGLKNFGYDIPVKEDGDYLIVLKFCEVYFRSPRQKVFDVVLNREHVVIPDLDIYREVGIATAHDEYIQFKVKGQLKTLDIDGAISPITNAKINIKFAKGAADNPKINAFYVIKGTIKDVPQLPPLQKELPQEDENPFGEEDEYEGDMAFDPQDISPKGNDFQAFSHGGGKGIRSGPLHSDPWEDAPQINKYFPILTSVLTFAVSIIIVYSIPK